MIPGVLSEAEVDFYAEALDRVYPARQAAGAVAPGGAMHLLSAVANCPEAVGLIDHPRAFSLVWSVLGWNIHIYHSHLDVHAIRGAVPVSSGTKTADGRTARSRLIRGRGCR